jgi:hypothetical protein
VSDEFDNGLIIVKLERELAEARGRQDSFADRLVAALTLAGQWREVAEDLNQAAEEISQEVEWPPLDKALAEFRKLKEASK